VGNTKVTHPADVGVLVVHGIGNQTKGSSLRGVVDPLFEHLTDQLAVGGIPAPGLRPVDCDDDAPTARIEVPAFGTPPAADEMPAQSWLLREAHWAEAFDAPSRTETATWLASIGSWFVFFFMARLWRRFGVEWIRTLLGIATAAGVVVSLVGAWHDDVGWALGGLWAATLIGAVSIAIGDGPGPRPGGLVVAGTILLLYPLASLLTVGVIALAVLGLLPIPGAKRLRQFQVALAGTIGDAYSLVSTPRRERAMRDVIRCSLEDLCEAVGPDLPIVLLCHSQGAALTYRLLRHEWPAVLEDRRVTLITYGSAIVPIHVLEYRFRSKYGRLSRGIVAALGLLSLLGLALLLVRAAVLGDAVWWWWVLTLAGLAVSLFAALRDADCLDGGNALPEDDKALDALLTTTEKPTPGLTEHGPTDPVAGLESTMAQQRGGLEKEQPGPSAEADDTAVHDEEAGTPSGPEPARRLISAECPERLFIPGLAPHRPGLRWVDLWAAWDPVPNGPLALSRPRAIPRTDEGAFHTLRPTWPTDSIVLPEPYLVSNDHQPWFDHVTYRTNVEEVVGRIAMEIGAAVAPDAVDVSRLEHADAPPTPPAPPPPPVQLANPGAEAARRARRIRGWWLFGGQLAAVVVASIALTLRREQIGLLGDWANAAFPSPARSALSGLIDVVPVQVRDVLAGNARDPGHGYGLLLSLLLVVGLLALMFAIVRSWQARATDLFTRGSSGRGSADG
jgi:hypothetical protein